MDRRIVWAVVLMMVIAIVPSFFLKKPAPRPANVPAAAAPDTAARTVAPPPTLLPAPGASPETDALGSADTVQVASPLYTYGITTRGARFSEVTLKEYTSMAPGERGEQVQLTRDESNLLGLRVLAGGDTLHLNRWLYTPSTLSLNASSSRPLALSANQAGVGVQLEYRFDPSSYQFTVEGQIQGLGPNGGVLLVGLGPGMQNTEADSMDNYRQLAVVTEANGAEATHFSKLEAGQVTTFSGPFDWVAVKSKYFVTAVFQLDTTRPRITGVTATPPATAGKDPVVADVAVSIPIGADGRFSFSAYAGPMEQGRLRAIGHDFDDVNPYGWPGFRTVIRPVAMAVRWLLVWMHDHLNLAYGVVLVIFGIMIRVVLWPLNQKAMRSSMMMQAIQPELKVIQERYKNEPQKLQQEMFKIYKAHGVNPFGGCWPLLIPMPVLFALFFVLGNTIELRGESFLWLPDLSRPDPWYIVPVLMGASMFLLSKVGSRGMPPSPQMKMMTYVMPAMMTLLFLNFASGLNLYYAVQNFASIPQQWLLSQERLRRATPAAPATNPQPAPRNRKEAKGKP